MKKLENPGKMKVQKTISLDLDTLRLVLDEAYDMGRDFSGTINVLIRMGLGVRSAQRANDEAAIRAEAARLSGARKE